MGRARPVLRGRSAASVALNWLALDGVPVRRRSAVLHSGPGDRGPLRTAPWWVYLACESLPATLVAAETPVELAATLIGGERLAGRVRIVERRDDEYGTELLLAGIARPLVSRGE